MFASERVRLRPMVSDDATVLYEMRSDPEHHMITDDSPMLIESLAARRARLERSLADADADTQVGHHPYRHRRVRGNRRRVLHARGDLDEQLDAARQDWATRTAPMRLAAIQANWLLRRRYPQLTLEPLRSAEPEPLADKLAETTPAASEQHAALVPRPASVAV